MVIVDKVALLFAGWNCKVDKAAFVVSRVPLKVKLENDVVGQEGEQVRPGVGEVRRRVPVERERVVVR